MASGDELYVRYYMGSRGHGHEFLEVEFLPTGLLRYVNASRHRGGDIIKKEVFVDEHVTEAVAKMIEDSGILNEDDSTWPLPDREGAQELEVVMGKDHVSFGTAKSLTLVDVRECKDKDGLENFYYLTQDLRALVFSLVSLHWKIKPI